jgi:hypothetical protein
MGKINVEIVSRQDIEEIAYMTSFLINKGWKRTYLSYDCVERKSNLFDVEQNYVWEKDGVTRDAWVLRNYPGGEERIETKYFILEEAFNHQCCMDDEVNK